MENTAVLPLPWFRTKSDFTRQLSLEISSSHVLYGKEVRSIAKREDNDDVLFQVMNTAFEYAVVHLTWTSNDHSSGVFPYTELYTDWRELYENRLLTDSLDYEQEED